MLANRVFECREKWGQHGLPRTLPWWRSATLRELLLPPVTAGGTVAGTLELYWLLGLSLVALVLLQWSLIGSRSVDKRREFNRLVQKAQDFLDALHAHLLTGAGDLRVTLLLPHRDGDQDYLVPFLRNGNHTVSGRRLRIGQTKAVLDGVAGRAWQEGRLVTAGFPKSYEACEGIAERTAFQEAMCASNTFLASVEHGRNPKYVLASVLRVAGNRAGVVCVDGKESANILCGEEPITEMAPTKRDRHQAQLLEQLVDQCCRHLADHALTGLYKQAGATP